MATITFLRSMTGQQVTSSNAFDGVLNLDISTINSSRLSLTDGEDKINFFGSGFAFEMAGGQIVGVNGGTATSFSLTNVSGSVTYLNWTGFSVNAPTFFGYVVAQNWTALNTLLFNTGDTYKMTNGNDLARGFAVPCQR